MASEHITVKLPQLPSYPAGQDVKLEDMIYVWNSELGQLQHADVGQLPFGSGGGGGGTVTHLGSPFIVTLGDDQVSVVGGNTVISDVRLMGKTDYPVTTTQLNVTFRRDELIYDEDNGMVTIVGFALQSGEEITITPQGQQSGGGGGSLQPLWDEINALKAMLAPFMPTSSGANAARVWWTRSIDTIPPGWVEDEAWRDYTPIHANSASQIGLTTGQNEQTLTSDQQGTFQVSGINDRSSGSSRNNTWASFTFSGGGKSEVLSGGSGANVPRGPITVRLNDASQPFSVVQRSKFGLWIKYVGV